MIIETPQQTHCHRPPLSAPPQRMLDALVSHRIFIRGFARFLPKRPKKWTHRKDITFS